MHLARSRRVPSTPVKYFPPVIPAACGRNLIQEVDKKIRKGRREKEKKREKHFIIYVMLEDLCFLISKKNIFPKIHLKLLRTRTLVLKTVPIKSTKPTPKSDCERRKLKTLE